MAPLFAAGQSRGFAFVSYKTCEAAAVALGTLNGVEWPLASGSRLKVCEFSLLAMLLTARTAGPMLLPDLVTIPGPSTMLWARRLCMRGRWAAGRGGGPVPCILAVLPAPQRPTAPGPPPLASSCQLVSRLPTGPSTIWLGPLWCTVMSLLG